MMAEVIARWAGWSTDGQAVLFELYADHTIHVVSPEHEALYDRHGTLIVSRETGDSDGD